MRRRGETLAPSEKLFDGKPVAGETVMHWADEAAGIALVQAASDAAGKVVRAGGTRHHLAMIRHASRPSGPGSPSAAIPPASPFDVQP